MEDLEVLMTGQGQVFADPDPDKARAFFREKSRRMDNKLVPLKNAVAEFVKDGDYLVVGGFGANRTPMAAVHEIVRQGRKNMAFAGHTSTHDMQVLCAGGVFDRLDVAYVVGLEARGLSYCSRKYLEERKTLINEDTNYGLALRFQAAAMGVPFIPVRNVMGTDTFKYGCGKEIRCPFTGKKLVIKPAIYPDIAIIHVHESDVYGNCRFKGITVSDLDVAKAAKRVIITAERIISSEEIRRDPSQTLIPFYLVDAVCEVPFGAYPGNMPYEYFSDEEHLKEWMTVERDPEVFKEFLKKNIYDCADHAEYIAKNGGEAKKLALRRQELLIQGRDQ